jgi:predicted transcriptional regulator
MPVYMSQAEYSRHRGVSQPMISKYIKIGKLKGCIKRFGKQKKIDMEKADIALSENLSELRRMHQEEPETREETVTITDSVSYAEFQKQQMKYKAGLAKLEYEKTKGKLIDAAQVEAEATDCAIKTREAFLALPSRLRNTLASEADPHKIEQLLETEIRTCLQWVGERTREA